MKVCIAITSGLVCLGTVTALAGCSDYGRLATSEVAVANSQVTVEPWINPTPHTYREGDRFSEAYGPLIEVPDWTARRLAAPGIDSRWIRYAETYLLIDSKTGIILGVVQASWGGGRA